MKKHLSDSVLKKIKQEHIVPRSRWYFILRNILGMILGILFFCFGALASAIIFHFLNFSESLEFLLESPRIFAKVIFLGVPLLWIGLSVFFGVMALMFAKRTNKGYKVSLILWAIIIFLPQIVAGFFLEQSQVGEELDDGMARHMTFYRSVNQQRHDLWTNAEDGFLAGTIIKIEDDTFLVLDDLHEQEWVVDYSESKYRSDKILKEGQKVKMIGERISDHEFKALGIRPWMGGHWKRRFVPEMGPRGEFIDLQKAKNKLIPPIRPPRPEEMFPPRF
ncbi:hypothetical protein K9L27_02630 [Candidatus Gracilibacteria bacterium]|nr:hypothetical protein [Candidatus Gracilibacteria bacterium]